MSEGGSENISRRNFLKKGAITATAVAAAAVGWNLGVTDAEEAPSAPKPKASVQPPPSRPLPVIEAVATGKPSASNDHADWEPKTGSIYPQVPDEFNTSPSGLSEDQIRALPEGDPMKEELLKQIAQIQSTKKKP